MVARERLKQGNYFSAPKSNLQFIPSGSKLLDLSLGGGWCEERIINVVGDKATGKTLLMIEASANFARKYPKGKIRYREAESAFDKPYAGALGMPIERIDFGGDAPMETVEDMFEDLQKIVTKAKQKELVIVDSLDALSDRSEMKRDMDEGTYGAQKAKMLSQLFRRLTSQLADSQVTLIIVSQVRDKIGVSFGRKFSRSGGKALDFYASQVVYLAHVGRLTRKVSGLARATGVKVLAKIDKSKVGLPFREAAFDVRFGYGIDDVQSCVDWLKECRSLKLADIRESEVKDYLDWVLAMSPEDGQKEIDRIRAIVEHKWYEIEDKLLTPRKKYG